MCSQTFFRIEDPTQYLYFGPHPTTHSQFSTNLKSGGAIYRPTSKPKPLLLCQDALPPGASQVIYHDVGRKTNTFFLNLQSIHIGANFDSDFFHQLRNISPFGRNLRRHAVLESLYHHTPNSNLHLTPKLQARLLLSHHRARLPGCVGVRLLLIAGDPPPGGGVGWVRPNPTPPWLLWDLPKKRGKSENKKLKMQN